MPHLAVALVILQLFVVLFIALHDWVKLGPLNNIAAVHSADPPAKLIAVTVLSTLPFAIGLAASIASLRSAMPMWLIWYLWGCYGAAFYGLLRAWWVPYLLVAEPARVARYHTMFDRTHAFLPEHNGIRPNTLHVLLHAVILAILALLLVLSR